MSNDPWDDLPQGDFVKWENIGDKVVGDVKGKGVGPDFNGQDVPQLVIRQDDGEDVTVTAGQANLRAQLLAARPQVGDRIQITFTHTEPPAVKGRDPKKCFEVKVKSGGAKSAPEPPAESTTTTVTQDDDDF